MVLTDFLKLTQAERAEHVFHFGTFLVCSEERGNLYHMEDFYAEVLYNPDLNEIQEVRGFANTKELEPYLREMEI